MRGRTPSIEGRGNGYGKQKSPPERVGIFIYHNATAFHLVYGYGRKKPLKGTV